MNAGCIIVTTLTPIVVPSASMIEVIGWMNGCRRRGEEGFRVTDADGRVLYVRIDAIVFVAERS